MRLISLLFLFLLLLPAQADAVTANIGTITTNSDDCVVFACVEVNTAGASNATISITGTFTGPLQFEGSIDNRQSWFSITGSSIGGSATGTFTDGVAGQWAITNALTNIRVRGSDTITGTASVHILTTQFGGGGSGGSSGVISGTVGITGNVGVTQQTSPWIVLGNSADDSTNSTAKQPVLICKATASNPSWTEGRQVPCRVDLTTGAIAVYIPENGMSAKVVESAAAANQDAASIKASAGVLYGGDCTNINAAVAYIKIYNDDTPTSAETPVIKFLIPGSTTGGGHALPIPPDGIAFATSIGSRFTTALANNSTAAVATGEVLCNFFYR
jgi:hypothetical protein